MLLIVQDNMRDNPKLWCKSRPQNASDKQAFQALMQTIRSKKE